MTDMLTQLRMAQGEQSRQSWKHIVARGGERRLMFEVFSSRYTDANS